MKQFVQDRYQSLLIAVAEMPELKNLPVKNPGAIAEQVKQALVDLKSYFTENPFFDQSEQIQFFKYEKPAFYSEYIYAAELFTIESNKPITEETVIRSYYEQELRFIKRFFDQNRFLYQYYLLDGIELDIIYFTPGVKNTDVPLPEAADPDPAFFAPGDFIFSKFMALERVQNYLINLLYPPTGNEKRGPNAGVSLRWTGDKINLVELAYGIYNAAQVNDGEVHIVDIIAWLEKSFQVNLSRYFQMFSEIKNRKAVSKTRFLDHMGKMINLHIEQGDAFVPQKPRTVSGSKPVAKV
ncbi:MAG: RteC protein [Mucilaginibacter sp.]|nr:RteC protein [Mucilaginibacter sp.]